MKQKQMLFRRPAVVATVGSSAAWRAAQALRAGDGIDLVELRLDAFCPRSAPPAGEVLRGRRPLILTARHPSEGGIGSRTAAERRKLLSDNLPGAFAVDVELRSVNSLRSVLEEAARNGMVRIISCHDFRATPRLEVLRAAVAGARRAGAEVVKIATLLRGAGDLATLLALQASTRTPLATMGMGPLGRVSRLVLAAAGSCLNYGYLDRPQAPGQWPAAELARRIKEVSP